ncbi:MAG: RNA polymerase sigma factor [Chloroflexia bacterium]|nr:RNA polymerase sigma factor [Chloroflexia bacterium]
MEELSDKELMQKVKFGDIDKLSLLYERYKKPLFAYFFRIIGDKEQSEDLVQTVFYRILKYRKQYRGIGKFTTWMFGIAHNLVADTFRKKQKLPFLKESLEKEQKGNAKRCFRINGKSEQVQMVRLALKKLSFEKREALVLSKYHGLKYKEIAEILNVNENSVKQRVFRAIEELRQVYLELAN